MLENFVFENIPKDWTIQCELKGVNGDTLQTEVTAFLQAYKNYFKKGSWEIYIRTDNLGKSDPGKQTRNPATRKNN